MKILIAVIAVGLTACATPPQWISNYYNSQDPCQSVGRAPNTAPPSWCGASRSRTNIYNSNGNFIGYTRSPANP